ncbi:BTB/POZ and MATH domain-containing protein 3-like [Eucalyptus grandis]|uniref:BTB/POZ and MATH domain-containing protein 3-like n=1 Tax=Eucalyptus grandis TaxID=71139 RepID=UPI00192ECFDC|nr:BTB/POZ and MATH domain-containing protein 3-like [Eucalyptus grandis]
MWGYHLFLKRDDPEVSHYIKNDRRPALHFGDKIFKVHREILATRSPVFRAQLFGPIGNRDIEKLVVEDVDPYIFEAMLEFIYSNKFPDVSEIAGLISPFAYADVVLHLVAATDCYSLDRSRLLCKLKLGDQIMANVLATIVALANLK